MVKKIAIILMALVISLSFMGCESKGDYDITAYVKNVLAESYNNGSSAAAAATAVTSGNSATTAENAAVRFFEKYKMNPSDDQKAAMAEVLKKAYANSKYTVGEKTEASYGYDVVVTYEVQTTFQRLESDINSRREEAEKTGSTLDVGAEYIDNVIALCENSVDVPMYGDSGSITFDILVDEDLNLSINLNLFDQLDEAILPF